MTYTLYAQVIEYLDSEWMGAEREKKWALYDGAVDAVREFFKHYTNNLIERFFKSLKYEWMMGKLNQRVDNFVVNVIWKNMTAAITRKLGLKEYSRVANPRLHAEIVARVQGGQKLYLEGAHAVVSDRADTKKIKIEVHSESCAACAAEKRASAAKPEDAEQQVPAPVAAGAVEPAAAAPPHITYTVEISVINAREFKYVITCTCPDPSLCYCKHIWCADQVLCVEFSGIRLHIDGFRASSQDQEPDEPVSAASQNAGAASAAADDEDQSVTEVAAAAAAREAKYKEFWRSFVIDDLRQFITGMSVAEQRRFLQVGHQYLYDEEPHGRGRVHAVQTFTSAVRNAATRANGAPQRFAPAPKHGRPKSAIMALKQLPTHETMLERLSTAVSTAPAGATSSAAAAAAAATSAAVSTLIVMGGAALRAPSDRPRIPSAKAAANRPSPTAASSPIKAETARTRQSRERERENK